MNKFDGKTEYENNINSNQVDHRTALKPDDLALKPDDLIKINRCVCGGKAPFIESLDLYECKLCGVRYHKENGSSFHGIGVLDKPEKEFNFPEDQVGGCKDKLYKFGQQMADAVDKEVYDSYVKKSDERTMVEGLEGELIQALNKVSDRKAGSIEHTIKVLSAFIDSKIELNRVQMLPITGMKQCPVYLGVDMAKDKDASIYHSIDSSMNLEDLPAFLPLTDFTPEEFATIRNGDRFNVDGRTMQVRFEKEYIPGLRSLKVIKGSD